MVFVTGGTGLLGAHILVELAKRGKSIKALKRPTSQLSEVKTIFQFYFGDQYESKWELIHWVDGDILDVISLENGMKECDEVYHAAGLVSFIKKDFKKLLKINKRGTANVVNIALSLGVKKFAFVSSTAAIGRNKKSEFYTEESKWITAEENSNYAVSKFSAEMEVWRGEEEGLNVVIVNPSVIFGAGNWNESSLTMLKSIDKGLKFYTSGINAYVDARDVAYGLVELMEQNKFGEKYLTISENLDFKTLFTMMANQMGVVPPRMEAKPWMGQIAWRLEAFLSWFGKKPQLTRETVRTAFSSSKYSNQKITNELSIDFIPIQKSIANSVQYQQFKSKNLK